MHTHPWIWCRGVPRFLRFPSFQAGSLAGHLLSSCPGTPRLRPLRLQSPPHQTRFRPVTYCVLLSDTQNIGQVEGGNANLRKSAGMAQDLRIVSVYRLPLTISVLAYPFSRLGPYQIRTYCGTSTYRLPTTEYGRVLSRYRLDQRVHQLELRLRIKHLSQRGVPIELPHSPF